MNSLILRTTTRLLFPLLLLLAVYLTLRGHNHPGGGFIGGLVAAGAFCLHLIADGPTRMRAALRVPPVRLLGIGLLLALAAGLAPLTQGRPLLQGVWLTLSIGWGEPIKQGTPLLFDVGVTLVVVGFTLTIVLALEEER
ncbi:MAG: Na+/H+ antiporter subunit B [Planctomycetota bacterium]